MKKRYILALTLIGFTSMSAQIVLIRELMVIFYGNELSLGLTLANWLLWVALGSWFGRRIAGRIKRKVVTFTKCEIGLAFILPLSIIGARCIPFILNFSPGEIIGVLPMSLASLILLVPICSVSGFLFVLGCQIYKSKLPSAQIGHVYILESVGAGLGGLIVSLFLIPFLAPSYIMFGVATLNLFTAFLLLWKRKLLTLLTGFLVVIFLVVIFSGQINFLRNLSLNLQWENYELLTSKNSVYGNIAVTKRKNLYTVFNNGLYSFTVPDKLNSEKNAHFPLLEHPDPKQVLLIGGGSSGQLQEVLKHPVERVTYVELDPLVIKLAKKYLPPNKGLTNPKVEIITNMDGRLFIKRTEQTYDVIIINLPDPHTAQLNRFYTKRFYQEVKGVLTSNGILSFCMSSNPNYISKEQVQLYKTLKNTLKEVFPEVKITPGQTNYFLASKKKGSLTLDWQVLMNRLKQRGIQTKYMRKYYLYSELSKERINFFQNTLFKSKVTTINEDFKPIAYYYDLVLWNTYFKYSLKELFKTINSKKIYITFGIIFLGLLLPVGVKKVRRKIPNWGVLLCVGTSGFAEITFQILTLLAFQIIYGYVYYKLGIILTSYMIGLIFGGWWITNRLEKNKGDYKLFTKTQGMISVYPLILPLIFWTFLILKGKVTFWLGSNIIFPLLPIIPGVIGGFQFPLANKLYLESTDLETGKAAGLTYGLDLFGACVGAIVVSIFLVPIIGIIMTCFLTAALNLIGLTLLLILKRDRNLSIIS